MRWLLCRDRMGRLMNELNEPFSSLTGDESLNAGSFVPPVDVYEDEHGIQLKMEVPGVDEKDIDIRLENNVLTVSGERKLKRKKSRRTSTASSGAMAPSPAASPCPTPWTTIRVAASYDKGLLKISLGKRAEAKPKQIKVNIGKELSASREVSRISEQQPGCIAGRRGPKGLVSPDFCGMVRQRSAVDAHDPMSANI